MLKKLRFVDFELNLLQVGDIHISLIFVGDTRVNTLRVHPLITQFMRTRILTPSPLRYSLMCVLTCETLA